MAKEERPKKKQVFFIFFKLLLWCVGGIFIELILSIHLIGSRD